MCGGLLHIIYCLVNISADIFNSPAPHQSHHHHRPPSTTTRAPSHHQGGAIALYTLRSDTKLAGVVGLSTYVPLHDKPPIISNANTKTPIFLAHGDADQVVQYQYGQASYEELKEVGAEVEFKTYNGMQHSACPQELGDLATFLQRVLA